MTVIAVVATCDMSRMFAGRRCTVMAGATASQNLCVIDGDYWLPYGRVVAILANVRSLNMCRTLASCDGAVMAAYAVARDVGMVEICW